MGELKRERGVFTFQRLMLKKKLGTSTIRKMGHFINEQINYRDKCERVEKRLRR